MLIALKDVDCCFGDGSVFGGIGSYEEALTMIKEKDNVNVRAVAPSFLLSSPSSSCTLLCSASLVTGSSYCPHLSDDCLFLALVLEPSH